MRHAAPASRAPTPVRLAVVAGSTLVLALVLLAACEAERTDTAAPSVARPSPTDRPSPTAPVARTGSPAATERQSPSPTSTPVPTPGTPPPLALELVADGLSDPIGIVGGPDGGLYVLEQAGRVVSIGAEGGATTVADLTDRVGSGGERGLLGLALHPGWPETGRAFVDYTDLSGTTVISELSRTGDGLLDAASERVLLRVEQPAANHNGGQLAFGPDGYLYASLGDGGGGNDQFGHGQRPDTLLGTILRLDVDAGDPYGVPPDNPFVGGGGAPEVFAYGLRNPWRFSFDAATGNLWIGDVGQGSWEEVDRVPLGEAAGANFGWSLFEGAHCIAASGCDGSATVPPLAEYGTRQVGCAVTGGHVYRGAQVDGLFGWYLFADYCSGLLFGIRSDAPAGELAQPQLFLETGRRIPSFGEDADGELYVADYGGAVYRIVAAP